MVLAWHVVLFVEEERVDVFPKCWVINNDLGYWPDIKKVGVLIKDCSPPEKDKWGIVKIRIIGKNKIFDNYLEASRAATRACFKSDIESEKDDKLSFNSSKGRKIFQNRKYLEANEDTSDSEVESCASSLNSIPQKGKDNLEKNKTSTIISKKQEMLEDHKEKGHEDPSVPTTSQHEIGETNGHSGQCPGHDVILKKLCTRVSYLTLLLKGVADDVGLIKLQLETNTPDTLLPSNPPKDDYNFPFTDTNSLEEFEKSLENKETYLNFINFISRIGGESPYEFVKRIMGRLVTDEVAAKYSFTGHKGKIAIGQFLIAKALKDASRNVRALQKYTEHDIEKKFKDWLRHAPARFKKQNKPEEEADNII